MGHRIPDTGQLLTSASIASFLSVRPVAAKGNVSVVATYIQGSLTSELGMVEETFGQPFRRGRETRAEHRTVAAKGNVIADESPNLHSERALLPILDLET
ncbi:MAG: hypothetical protein FJ267_00570, partial [Planctomycetes bacterium]|nr:hypothetical protein [Planctomycetota bacterium]